MINIRLIKCHKSFSKEICLVTGENFKEIGSSTGNEVLKSIKEIIHRNNENMVSWGIRSISIKVLIYRSKGSVNIDLIQ